MMGAEDLPNSPVHEETVAPFRMGKNTVTNKEYGDWMRSLGAERYFLLKYDKKDSPSILARASNMEELRSIPIQSTVGELIQKGGMDTFQIIKIEDHNPPARFDRPKQPAVYVSWYDTAVYALMHGAMLATEPQREFVATEGGKKKYATRSGKLTKKEAHYHAKLTINVDDPRYPDGPFGIRHLTGNVWEWTANLWKAGELSRVLRGGSWHYVNPDYLRAAYRNDVNPGSRLNVIGFRLAAPEDSLSVDQAAK